MYIPVDTYDFYMKKIKGTSINLVMATGGPVSTPTIKDDIKFNIKDWALIKKGKIKMNKLDGFTSVILPEKNIIILPGPDLPEMMKP